MATRRDPITRHLDQLYVAAEQIDRLIAARLAHPTTSPYAHDGLRHALRAAVRLAGSSRWIRRQLDRACHAELSHRDRGRP